MTGGVLEMLGRFYELDAAISIAMAVRRWWRLHEAPAGSARGLDRVSTGDVREPEVEVSGCGRMN